MKRKHFVIGAAVIIAVFIIASLLITRISLYNFSSTALSYRFTFYRDSCASLRKLETMPDFKANKTGEKISFTYDDGNVELLITDEVSKTSRTLKKMKQRVAMNQVQMVSIQHYTLLGTFQSTDQPTMYSEIYTGGSQNDEVMEIVHIGKLDHAASVTFWLKDSTVPLPMNQPCFAAFSTTKAISLLSKI